jgi:hypothetical protein
VAVHAISNPFFIHFQTFDHLESESFSFQSPSSLFFFFFLKIKYNKAQIQVANKSDFQGFAFT